MIWQPEFTDKTLSRKPGAVQFIQWITASVTAHSRSVGEDSQPPLKQTDYIVKLAKDDTARAYDENCVVLTGRCSKSKRAVRTVLTK